MTKEQVNSPDLKQGDRVTVTLTGEVVGRGTTFLTVKVDGQEDKAFGAEKLIYIWRENDQVTVEKHEPLEQWEIELLTAPKPIVAGDVVRLTGKDWAEWDLLGGIVTVASVSPWGEPEFYDGAEPFAIFKNKHYDYSAEKVNP